MYSVYWYGIFPFIFFFSPCTMTEVIDKVAICKEFKLTEDQFQEYKSAFDMFDTDHSGDISADELVALMGQLGKEVTLTVINKNVSISCRSFIERFSIYL